ERPTLHVLEQRWRDLQIILNHLSFDNTIFRKQNFFQIAEFKLALAYVYPLRVLCHRRNITNAMKTSTYGNILMLIVRSGSSLRKEAAYNQRKTDATDGRNHSIAQHHVVRRNPEPQEVNHTSHKDEYKPVYPSGLTNYYHGLGLFQENVNR